MRVEQEAKSSFIGSKIHFTGKIKEVKEINEKIHRQVQYAEKTWGNKWREYDKKEEILAVWYLMVNCGELGLMNQQKLHSTNQLQ